MDEQLVQVSLETLGCNWQKLKSSLYDCDEIRTDFFFNTFEKTEQCLSQCVATNTVSKELIPLIGDIYTFVDVKVPESNVQMRTAQILAERLLYQYLVNKDVNPQNASCVTVYILNNRRQITIDLSRPALAFAIIEEALQF